MRIPVIEGIIDRRILVNYRADPEVVARVLPSPFRPKLHNGYAVVGICLIRLRDIRPWFLPARAGIRSENAAHRIAVEWHTRGGTATGVFIPRRDTSSRLNAMIGGRLFPGLHHHARFACHEQDGRHEIEIHSVDGVTAVSLKANATDDFPRDSIFQTIEQASSFFQSGSVGYSPTQQSGEFDGLKLSCSAWSMAPLKVEHIGSSYFDDINHFPCGAIQLDCALLMKDVKHQWHGLERLRAQ